MSGFDMKAVGERLKWRREFLGVNQADMAAKCGLVASHLSHFESGRRSPSLENFTKLCAALNVNAHAILFGGVYGTK